MDAEQALRAQGGACAALGSAMYADLCSLLADDLAAGGPTRAVLGRAERPAPDALALRLLAAVHRLVLERRAGVLAAYYPSVGGRWEPRAGGAAFLAVLEEHADEVGAALEVPPPTDEIGWGAALVGGLARLPDACRMPVRLVELGASAGLLLRSDRVRYVGSDGTSVGPADAVLEVGDAWPDGSRLRPWPLEVVERRGCDPRPLDATTPTGRTTLTSSCWPDQPERWERLRGALDLAARVPVTVERRGAADLAEALDLADGAVTVLWHAGVRPHLPPDDRSRLDARVDALLAAARPAAPFVHLALEPHRDRERGAGGSLTLQLRAAWGDDCVDRDLGTAAAQGLPVVWAP